MTGSGAAPTANLPEGQAEQARAGKLDPQWLQLAAEDLRMLGWLHASERPVGVLQQLCLNGFPEGLQLLPESQPEALAARQHMADILHAMCQLKDDVIPAMNDDLAADFAAIYLTHAHRAAPFESVWLDEDQLMLQGPTFAVRAFYRQYGLRADWRAMADDHLCNELAFVATMLEQGHADAALGFLQQHLLQWLPLFVGRVAQRADTAFYATLAQMTLLACQQCAAQLAATGVTPVTVDAPPACAANAQA